MLNILYIGRTDRGHHIPDDKLKRLEYFARINLLNDMEKRIPEAEDWFKEMIIELEVGGGKQC